MTVELSESTYRMKTYCTTCQKTQPVVYIGTGVMCSVCRGRLSLETNPGSPEAVEQGCQCPRSDNNNGQGMPGGLFWVGSDCPLHGGEKDE